MTTDTETWSRVARIARLELSPDELACLQGDAQSILAQFSSIQSLLASAPETKPETTLLRDDGVEPFPFPEKIRAAFPRQKEGVTVVPRGLR